MSLGLRIALVAILLSLIPLVFLRAVLEMEVVSRDTAERRLSAYAEVVASQLRGQQQWLHRQAPLSQLLSGVEGGDWFRTDTGMTIDGDMEDWSQFADRSRWFSAESLRDAPSADWQPTSLSFRKLAAADEKYLYLLFIVKDAERVWRRPGYLRIDLNDHVELLLANQEGEQQRFLLAPSKPGRVLGQRMPADAGNWVPEAVDKRLRAEWLETEGGYNVEVRLPRELAAGGIAFSVGDMDSLESTELSARIGSTLSAPMPELADDLRLGPVSDTVMRGLDQLPVRLRLLDSQRQFIATTGWPQARLNAHSPDESQLSPAWDGRRAYRWFVNRWLPVESHRRLMTADALAVDAVSDTGLRSSSSDRHILSAAAGSAEVVWQAMGSQNVWLLSAAVPVFSEGSPAKQAWKGGYAGPRAGSGQVIGLVVVEQVVNQAQLLASPMQWRWVQKALLVQLFVVVVVLVLLLHWVWRLRQVLLAVPQGGDYRPAPLGFSPLPGRPQEYKRSRFWRSEFRLLQQLFRDAEQQRFAGLGYRQYIEQDFTHELQGPVVEVATSLSLLQARMLEALPAEEQSTFQQLVGRASTGLDEMQCSLDRLAEGDRLVGMLGRARVCSFDAGDVCWQFAAAWQQKADRQVVYSGPIGACVLVGVEELLTLVLRELLDNAAEYSPPESVIEIALRRVAAGIDITVSNQQQVAELTGKGVGLHLVDLAATWCGGWLSVSSDNAQFTALATLHHQDLPAKS